MVLGLLAIVWVAVLGSYAKERMADRRTDSVSAFRSQLSTLQRTQPGGASSGVRTGAAVHYSRSASAMACAVARQRRKNILVGLLTAALVSVLVALVAPGVVTIGLAMLCVASFTGYVILLVDRQRVVSEQHAKVRPISSARTRPAVHRGTVRTPMTASASRR